MELELGHHADLIGELHELTSQNPLAQKLIHFFMLALYRSGRPDEALDLYRTTRRRLRTRQGIDPGPDLQKLHQRILEQDRTLLQIKPITALPPNNLPRTTRDFTGRTSELNILLAEPTSGDKMSTSLSLTVIHGMPGVGKTALAIRAAHSLLEFYPDGQFYVNLHAYSNQTPYDPVEALGVLLQATGFTEDLPDSLDERSARWRQWTARRRVLVILDNARNAAQVIPLLPGAAACRVIVTSRNRLAGLDGASSLFLDVLSETEAAALFTRIASPARISVNAAALGRVVAACACHPLALQLLASRFRHRDSWDLHHLLDRLTQAADPLDEFDDAVATAFRFSYAELSGPAQQLFRFLALHPGPDITLHAAVALTEVKATQLRNNLEELLDSHMLDEPVRDRYRFHDLTRAFAYQICSQTEPESDRRRAVNRLLRYHLTAAHRADKLAYSHHRTLPLGPGLESSYATHFRNADEARVWLALERANLLAAARASAAEAPKFAARFPHVLAKSLKLWGTWSIAAELYDAAIPTLRKEGSREALAQTLVEYAEVLAQRNHQEAQRCTTEALALFQELKDARGCADALLQSGRAHLAGGHGDIALSVLDQALNVYQKVGDRFGAGECLNVQGAALHYAGRYKEATRKVQAMLLIHKELQDESGQMRALNNMGELCYRQGRYEDARDYYEQSLLLAQQYGGRQELAILDTNLGAIYQATGQTVRALSCFQRALESHRAASDALGEANALINMGTAYAEGGQKQEALLHFQMAEEVARRIDNSYERQRALIGAANVRRESGQIDSALRIFKQALDIAQNANFPLGSAQAFTGLAQTALSLNNLELARSYGAQAIALYRSLEANAEADRIESLLANQGGINS